MKEHISLGPDVFAEGIAGDPVRCEWAWQGALH